MRSHTVFGFERPLESRAKSSFGYRLGKESRPGRAAQEKGVILPLLPCGDEMFLLSAESCRKTLGRSASAEVRKVSPDSSWIVRARGCRMRVVLGVAGIRMRMDDLDAVDLVRMVKERRSAVIPCKERDERPVQLFCASSLSFRRKFSQIDGIFYSRRFGSFPFALFSRTATYRIQRESIRPSERICIGR